MRLPKRVHLVFDRRLTASTLLDVASELHADKPLLRPEGPLPYPGLGGLAITAAMAHRFAVRCGEALCDGGMERGDRVAIFKANEVDYALLSLAVIRAGGIAVPVNAKMGHEDLARHLRHAGARILCCDSRSFTKCVHDQRSLPSVEVWVFTDKAPVSVTPNIVLSEVLKGRSGNVPPVRLVPDDPVILAHTSGTTGSPKLVTCTAASFLAGIRTHFRTEPPIPWKRIGIAGPFSHLVYQIGLSTLLLSGGSAWALDGDDAGAALAMIERKRLNTFVAFPYLYMRMYAHGLDSHDLRSMRLWISVGDASHEAHMTAFCKQGCRFGGSLFIEPLGSSEIGGPALRRLWTSASRVRCRRHIGRPMLGGPRVKVVNAEGRRAAAGQAGRLVVKGSTLFAGYWGGDGWSEDSKRGWWATGDLACRDRWGRYFHLDRESDVVSTLAGPFYTLPMEDVLHSHPGVYEAVVFGVPAGDGHEEPIAVVWVDPEAGLEGSQLMRWANGRGRGNGLASVTVLAPELIPRGLTGKVQKARLREAHAQGRGGRVDA